MKRLKLATLFFLIFITTNFLTGCALLLIGGLAGTTGYFAAKQGYSVQSPIIKKNKQK